MIFQDTKVGSIVFDKFATKDLDSNVNGQVEYIIADPENEFFEIDLPHQGILTLKRELDYETQKIHRVQIIARVRDFLYKSISRNFLKERKNSRIFNFNFSLKDRATNPDQRLSASTTLTVNVIDSDDQSPRFIHDLYTSKVRIFILVSSNTGDIPLYFFEYFRLFLELILELWKFPQKKFMQKTKIL